MHREWYKPPAWLVWAMWLVLARTGFEYWQAWELLPPRMAVHFDAEWHPNGFTSREGALYLGLGIMVTMLVLFTVGALAARVLKPSAAWPLLAVFYITLGVAWYANHSIIKFNLNAVSQHSELAQKVSPVVNGEVNVVS